MTIPAAFLTLLSVAISIFILYWTIRTAVSTAIRNTDKERQQAAEAKESQAVRATPQDEHTQ